MIQSSYRKTKVFVFLNEKPPIHTWCAHNAPSRARAFYVPLGRLIWHYSFFFRYFFPFSFPFYYYLSSSVFKSDKKIIKNYHYWDALKIKCLYKHKHTEGWIINTVGWLVCLFFFIGYKNMTLLKSLHR